MSAQRRAIVDEARSHAELAVFRISAIQCALKDDPDSLLGRLERADASLNEAKRQLKKFKQMIEQADFVLEKSDVNTR